MALGAGILDKNGLPKERQKIIDSIGNLIEEFRQYAFQNNKSKKENRYGVDKYPTNFISILGDRGAGKTSTLMTIHRELNIANNCCDMKGGNYKNIVLNIVDPAKFNVEENALGWIIYLFQDQVNRLMHKNKSGYCDSKKHIKELEQAYEKLKDTYVKSRPYFRGGTQNLSEGTYEYKKINEEIIFSDMNLDSIFRGFIDKFIVAIKNERNENVEKSENEPMIFITFDDVDISPEHGYQILRSVLNYLKHANLVVFILGKYKTFKEGVIIDSLHREKIAEFDLEKSYVHKKRTMIQERTIRAEEFIEKVLPFSYRYDLEGLNLRDRLNFKPYADNDTQSLKEFFERIKIYNHAERMGERNSFVGAFGKVFYSDSETYWGKNDGDFRIFRMGTSDKNDTYLNEKIEAFSEVTKNESYCEVSAYAHILFKNPRGLINFYQRIEKEFSDLTLYMKPDNLYFQNYDDVKVRLDENFAFIYKLYCYLKYNVELAEGTYDIEEIFKIDPDIKRVNFNFKHIDIKSDAVKREDRFLFSKNILIMRWKKGEREGQLNVTQSAFIQFFYDLTQSLLTEEYINIGEGNDKDLGNISIYKDESSYVEIKCINFRYFYEYYMMQNLISVLYTVIQNVREGKRNSTISETRSRLKRYLIYMLEIINDKNFFNSNVLELNLMEGDKEIQNKFVESIKDKYGVCIENTSFKNGEMRKYNLLEYIKYFRELREILSYEYKTLIESDDKLKNLSMLLEVIWSKSNNSTKINNIREILEEIKVEYVELSTLKSMIENNVEWDTLRRELERIRVCLIRLIYDKLDSKEDIIKYIGVLNEILNSLNRNNETRNEIKSIVDKMNHSLENLSKENENEYMKVLNKFETRKYELESYFEKKCEKLLRRINEHKDNTSFASEYHLNSIRHIKEQFQNEFGKLYENCYKAKSSDEVIGIMNSLIPEFEIASKIFYDALYEVELKISKWERDTARRKKEEQNVENELKTIDLNMFRNYISRSDLGSKIYVLEVLEKNGGTKAGRKSLIEYIESIDNGDLYLKELVKKVKLLDTIDGTRARGIASEHLINPMKDIIKEEITNE